MNVEETGSRLRSCRASPDASPTCRRMCEAFALIDDLDTLAEISLGVVTVGQRVTVVSGGSVGSSDGVVKGGNGAPGTLVVVFDSGTVSAVPESDVIGLIKEQDPRLDFVSRMVWAQSLTEGRLPLSGSHLLPDYCPWEMCEHAFHLTEPWTEQLWASPPALADVGFNSWLYLFAESIRMKVKGSLMLALRIVEECSKHVGVAERAGSSEAAHRAFAVGTAELVRYWPAAACALGQAATGGSNGAFAILRHMVSTQAVKVLRALYRKPVQTDMGSEVALDKALLRRRCAYYITMQCTAEDELRGYFSAETSCASLFGDGQGHWNAAWLCSVESDAVGVCRALRKAIEQADACGDSEFVAAKSRWDLAGYLSLGGEGETYDLRQVSKLAKEAEELSDRLEILGMKFFVDGESICSNMVKAIIAQYSGKAPHVVPVQRLGGAPGKGNTPPRKDACANCQKAADANTKLLVCGKCKLVKYCSRECQVAHFKAGHKKECKA